MLDYLIINGKYPDYEAGKLKEGNIGIKDGKIASIDAEMHPAAQIIDAAGKVVSPGFIDIHMHEEWFESEGELTEKTVTLAPGKWQTVKIATVPVPYREFFPNS